MKVTQILGEDREPTYTKTVEGCRGILIRDGKILLSYYKNIDQYLIPGGGLEDGETLSDCCIRELKEETGILVKTLDHYLTLEEYYHEYYFKSHYFVVEYVGESDRALTKTEIKEGLEPRWIGLDEAMKIFGDYESYKDTNEMRYGAYYREYIALCEYKKRDCRIW